jgi:hypothetical protein
MENQVENQVEKSNNEYQMPDQEKESNDDQMEKSSVEIQTKDPNEESDNCVQTKDPKEESNNCVQTKDPNEESDNCVQMKDPKEESDNCVQMKDPKEEADNCVQMKDPKEESDNCVQMKDPKEEADNCVQMKDPKEESDNCVQMKDPKEESDDEDGENQESDTSFEKTIDFTKNHNDEIQTIVRRAKEQLILAMNLKKIYENELKKKSDDECGIKRKFEADPIEDTTQENNKKKIIRLDKPSSRNVPLYELNSVNSHKKYNHINSHKKYDRDQHDELNSVNSHKKYDHDQHDELNSVNSHKKYDHDQHELSYAKDLSNVNNVPRRCSNRICSVILSSPEAVKDHFYTCVSKYIKCWFCPNTIDTLIKDEDGNRWMNDQEFSDAVKEHNQYGCIEDATFKCTKCGSTLKKTVIGKEFLKAVNHHKNKNCHRTKVCSVCDAICLISDDHNCIKSNEKYMTNYTHSSSRKNNNNDNSLKCYACNLKMPKNKIKEHRESCGHVKIKCEKCSFHVVRNRMRDHVTFFCSKVK